MKCALLSVLSILFLFFSVGCKEEEEETPIDEFDGLTEEVAISRDSMGVVHIFGETDRDVFFASGYMQALDRLFQMDLVRRQAMGRQSEVFGASTLSEDRTLRALDLTRWGRASAERLHEENPEAYGLLVAWTAGVNTRIEEVLAGEAELPYGFGPEELDYLPERWDVADALIVGKLLLFGNDGRLEFELFATLAAAIHVGFMENAALVQSLTDAYIMPPEERPHDDDTRSGSPPVPRRPWIGPLPQGSEQEIRRAFRQLARALPSGASNNWAVAGEHTENGRPLIAGDPHQPLHSPSRFWLQHINSADAGGSFNVIGFSFVGSPGVQLGHNADVAWTATTMGADVLDLWDVELTEHGVMIGDQEVEAIARTEEIIVRGAESEAVEVIEIPGYGYIVPDGLLPLPITAPGRTLLVNWTGFAPTNEAAGFFGFDRAGSIEEFEQAVDAMDGGSFNWIAADAAGITYRNGINVPARGPHTLDAPPWMVLSGDDPSTFWTGEFLTLEQMPRSRGGERGWLGSANNDPFGFTADGDTSNDPWYFGAFFDPGTRAARIEGELERLTAEGGVTVEDMMAMQLDSYTLVADMVLPVVAEVLAAVETDEELEEYRDREDIEQLVGAIVDDWDRRMVGDSGEALAFHAFLYFLVERAVADDIFAVYGAIMDAEPIYVIKLATQAVTGSSVRGDGILQQGRNRVVMMALDDASQFLTERYGDVDPALYRWGEFHGAHFTNPFGERLYGPWVSVDGADGTLNCFPANFFLEDGEPVDQLRSEKGPVYRLVASFAEDGVPEALINFARGNTADPDDDYFDNALQDWLDGVYRPLLFRSDAVNADVAESWTLEP